MVIIKLKLNHCLNAIKKIKIMGKFIVVCLFILFNVPFVYDMLNGTAWDPYFQDHNILRLALGY